MFFNHYSNQGTILFGEWHGKENKYTLISPAQEVNRWALHPWPPQGVVRKAAQPRLCYSEQAHFWEEWHGVGSVQKIPAGHPEAFAPMPFQCCATCVVLGRPPCLSGWKMRRLEDMSSKVSSGLNVLLFSFSLWNIQAQDLTHYSYNRVLVVP